MVENNGVRFAPIAGALRRYLITDDGRIHTVGRRHGWLSAGVDKAGYAVVALWMENGRRVRHRLHRLVATAFVPALASDKRLEVDHLDSNRSNCRAENLEWVTHSENIDRMYRRGRGNTNPRRGEQSKQHKLTEPQVREVLDSDESSRKIAARMGVGKSVVLGIRKGIDWPHIPRESEAFLGQETK